MGSAIKFQIAITIAIAVFTSACAEVTSENVVYENTEMNVEVTDESSVSDVTAPEKSTEPIAEEEKTGIEALWYYEPERADRYAAFSAARPDLTEEEVVWMVGCDLDLTPYEDVSSVPDPKDILLLVNKYYFLPEDYVPDDLISVGNTQMRKEAGEALLEMIDAAASENNKLWSQSGYRNYSLQARLYNDYVERSGQEAAEKSSARPGHSEHQTGLTTDLNTITEAFGETAEGKWVADNCHEYGFIIRYTMDNLDVTHFKYEPWHIRYVGKEAAMTIHEKGIASFEEYWVKYVKHKPLY